MAAAAGVEGARWSRGEYIVEFSDSVGYSVDVGASDSTQLVVRINGADPAAIPSRTALQRGPRGSEAALTRTPEGGLRLTIRFRERRGYSILWRPYSHRLIVHTFDWNRLPYAQEQYHKGLLALEGGMTRQAEELLAVAFATGEERAGSVLGVHYARRGKDSLAARYLGRAIDEDDRAALAEIEGRPQGAKARGSTDTADHREGGDGAAGYDDGAFEDRSNPEDHVADGRWPDGSNGDGSQSPQADTGLNLSTLSDWRTIASIAVALMTFIVILVFLFRRNASKAQREGAKGAVQETPQGSRDYRVVPSTPAVPEQSREKAPETIPVQRPAASEVVAPVAAPVVEPPAAPVQPPVVAEVEPVTVQEKAPVIEERPVPAPVPQETAPVRETPIEAAAPAVDEEKAPAASTRLVSTQAAELQRRMESARTGAATPADDESTVSEARRLNVSRDNIELRRRMSDLRRKLDQPADTWEK